MFCRRAITFFPAPLSKPLARQSKALEEGMGSGVGRVETAAKIAM
jgi:hypothetical protein